jgi:hypothetical protein
MKTTVALRSSQDVFTEYLRDMRGRTEGGALYRLIIRYGYDVDGTICMHGRGIKVLALLKGCDGGKMDVWRGGWMGGRVNRLQGGWMDGWTDRYIRYIR